jgi:FkbM family methyltransferase
MTATTVGYEMPRSVRAQLVEVKTRWGVLTGPRTDRITRSLLADGEYEWAETAIVGQILRRSSIAVDVGANIGYYTAMFRQLVGEKGAVHSFEANPFTAELLNITAEANHWRNVTINHIALGDSDATLRVRAMDLANDIQREDFNLGGWTLREVANGDWTVPVTTLDHYVAQRGIERVHMLKVDVEGFEHKVLRGADEVLRRNHPYLMLELNAKGDIELAHTAELIAFLEKRRYRLCRILKQPFPHFRPLTGLDLPEDGYHFNALAIPQARYDEFRESISGFS